MGNNPFARDVHSHNPLRNCVDFAVSYSFDQTRETKYLFHAIADETVRYQQQKQQSCAMTVFPTIKNR